MKSILPFFITTVAVMLLASDSPAAEPRREQNVDFKQGRRERLAFDQRGRLRLIKGEKGYTAEGQYSSAILDRSKPGKVRVGWIEQWTTPLLWKKFESNPIFGPKQTGKWDGWTNGVSIVRNSNGKTYKMFYSGRQGAGIGFAEAKIDEPLNWKENPASPVLRPRTDNWEGNLLNQPRVVKVTDKHWRMYYTGWGYKGEGSARGSSWTFGLAESHDGGVTWKRVGDKPLLARGNADSPDGGGVCVPEVRRIGNQWMMWYTAMKVAEGKQYIHLCLATSDDGLHWTKSKRNPVLSADFAAGPKRNVISRCFVRYDRGVFKMWYSHASPAYRIRYAESLDGIDWELAPISPVLGPGEKGAWDDQMVEYPEVDVVEGRYHLWFCGNGFGSVGYSEGISEAGVRLSIRSGNSPLVDANWSDWSAVKRDSIIAVHRFVQLRAEMWTKNARVSPALNRLWLESAGN